MNDARLIAVLWLFAGGTPLLHAQENPPAPSGTSGEIAALRARIEAQQSQIRQLQEILRQAAEQQAKQRSTLDALQIRLEQLESEADSVSSPAVAASATPGIVEAGYGKIKYDGLVQAWYQGGDEGFHDSFRIRRAEMKFGGDIDPRVRWSVMFDLAKALTLTDTLTAVDVNQGSRILQDAFITLNLHRRAHLDVGQFKIPLSLEGLQSSAELDTERALFASDRARGGTYGDVRDIGAMLHGPLTSQMDYQFGVFNGSGENQNDLDRNDQKALGGRLVFRPNAIPGLQIGGSAVWGNGERADRPRRDRWGAELLYARGPFTFKSEYMTGEDGMLSREGYYGHLAYQFAPKWEGIFRYDTWDPDTSRDTDLADVAERDYVAGFNYLIHGDRAAFQFNYLWKTFEDELVDSMQLAVFKLQAWW